MTIKERLPIHKRTYPYFLLILGLLFGLGIATDLNLKLIGNWYWDVSLKTQLETEKSAWDIVASIGSLLAGLGTVGLLAFGWFKAANWLTQMKNDKRISLILETSNNLIKASYSFDNYLSENVYPFLKSKNSSWEYQEQEISVDKQVIVSHFKQISIHLDILSYLVSDNVHLEDEAQTIEKYLIKIHRSIFTNLDCHFKEEMQTLTTMFVHDTKRIQRTIIRELLR